MKKTVKEKLEGFTLLELTLVMSIIGIMTGVSLVSFSSSRNNARLKAAQAELASTIKLTQSYALQGKTLPSPINTPKFYGVRIFNESSYGICRCDNKYCTDTSNNPVCMQSIDSEVVENHSFPSGVEVNNDDALITFEVPHGNVTINPTSDPLILELNIPGDSQNKYVRIYANGNIVED